MLSKYQYNGQGFWHGTHRLGLFCTNLGRKALVVEMEERPYDLCLTCLHTFLLRAYVKVDVVLGFFCRPSLDCFRLGFLMSY